MARVPERVPGSSSIDFLYEHHGEMPRSEIEKAAGKEFSVDERREIFECAEAYSWEKGHIDGMALRKDVIKLRKKLLGHTTALVELAKRYSSRLDASEFSLGYGSDDDQKTFTSLVFSYKYSIRDDLRAAALHCQRLTAALEEPQSISAKRPNVTSETAALGAFVKAVLTGANAEKARGGYDQYTGKVAHDYERWGLAVGPTVAAFQRFSGAVLQRSVLDGQLKEAFKSASEYSFGTI